MRAKVHQSKCPETSCLSPYTWRQCAIHNLTVIFAGLLHFPALKTLGDSHKWWSHDPANLMWLFLTAASVSIAHRPPLQYHLSPSVHGAGVTQYTDQALMANLRIGNALSFLACFSVFREACTNTPNKLRQQRAAVSGFPQHS